MSSDDNSSSVAIVAILLIAILAGALALFLLFHAPTHTNTILVPVPTLPTVAPSASVSPS